MPFQKLSRVNFVGLPVLLLFSAACSDHTAKGVSKPSLSENALVSCQPDQSPMERDPAVCSGPWRVSRPTVCTDTQPVCGCERYDTHIVRISEVFNENQPMQRTCPAGGCTICEHIGPPPCYRRPATPEETRLIHEGYAGLECDSLRRTLEESILTDHVNTSLISGSSDVTTTSFNGTTGAWTGRCEVTIEYAHDVEQDDPDSCLAYKACSERHSTCPIESSEHNAESAGAAMQLACAGDASCEDSASTGCLLGTDIPHLNQRFSFLRDEIVRSSPPVDATLKDKQTEQILKLYEYHGGDPSLSKDDREFARQLYQNNTARNSLSSCGPELTSGSCNDELTWRLDYCARLTGTHVDPRLLFGELPGFQPAEHASSTSADGTVSQSTAFKFCSDLAVRATTLALNSESCDATLVRDTLDIQRQLLDQIGSIFSSRFSEDRCNQNAGDRLARLKPMLAALADAETALELAEYWITDYRRSLTDPTDVTLEDYYSGEVSDQHLTTLLTDFWSHLDNAIALTETMEGVLAEPASEATCADYAGLEDAGGPNGLVAFLQEANERSQDAHHSVLEAAGTSLNGDVLAAILGHITQGMVSRLEALSASHDLSCRITGNCRASSATATALHTELAYTYRLLSLLDRSNLTSPSGAPDLTDSVSEAHESVWKESIAEFAASGGQQILIDALLAELQRIDPSVTEYRPEFLDDYPLSEFALPYRELIASLNAARKRITSYQKSGVFNPDSGATLYSPVHDARRDDIVSVLSSRTADLDAQLATFESDIRTVLGDWLASTSNRDDIQRLELSAELLRERLERNLEQQDAHALSAAAQPLSDQIMQAWIDLEGVLDSGTTAIQYLQTAQYPSDGSVFSVSGAHAAGSADSTSVGSLAVPWNGGASFVSVEPGDIFSVLVAPQEQWSPNCVLESLEMYPSVAGEPTQRLSAPLTGPSGYMLSNESGVLSATERSSSSVESESAGRQTTVCAKGGGSFEFGPLTFGADVSICDNIGGTTYTESSSLTTSETTQTRASASFQGGLHSELTPFDAPVGSLVVVEMPRGETDVRRFRDIHIVTAPTTTIVVRNDASRLGSDFYLAVNDATSFCTDRGATPDTRPLNVRMVTLSDAHSQARATLDAMGEMLGFMREQEALLAAQGDILPNQLQAIEDQARTLLPASVRSESTYPAPLGEAFDALVTAEKSRLEHVVKLSVLQDEQYRLAKELNILKGQIAFAEEKGEFLRALPRWSVANLGLDFLYEDAVAINRIMGEFVLPVMELWYPEVLAELRVARQSELSALQNQTTTESLYLSGKLTRDIADFVVDAIPTANLPLTLQQYQVALSIPRPDNTSCHPLLGCDAASATSFTPNPRTSPAQAAAVWAAIESGEPATFALEPHDLYLPGGQGVLVCGDLNPVLRNIGLAVVPRDHNAQLSPTPGYLGVRAKLFNGRSQDFTSSGEVVSYRLNNERDLSRTIPVVPGNRQIGANSYDAMVQAAWAQNPSSQLVGRSPFSTFTVDLSEAVSTSGPITPTDIANASELVLYMDVEVLEGAPSETNYIATCLDEGTSSTTCSDTIDNDRDGLFDCQDPDCSDYSICVP